MKQGLENFEELSKCEVVNASCHEILSDISQEILEVLLPLETIRFLQSTHNLTSITTRVSTTFGELIRQVIAKSDQLELGVDELESLWIESYELSICEAPISCASSSMATVLFFLNYVYENEISGSDAMKEINLIVHSALQVGADGEFIRDAARIITPNMAQISHQSQDGKHFLARVILLSNDLVETGQLRIKEGIGAARYELMTGYRMQDGPDMGVDFENATTGEKISLKGPILKNDGTPVPASIWPQAVKGLALSVIKGSRNDKVSLIVVDLFGLSATEKAYVKNMISDSGVTMPIDYIE
jgi:hypothetical protein